MHQLLPIVRRKRVPLLPPDSDVAADWRPQPSALTARDVAPAPSPASGEIDPGGSGRESAQSPRMPVPNAGEAPPSGSGANEIGRDGFHSVPHPETGIGDAVERVRTTVGQASAPECPEISRVHQNAATGAGERNAATGANDEARPGDVTAALRSFGKVKAR
jgi:hypothetical protein